jgi:hypothetical protein
MLFCMLYNIEKIINFATVQGGNKSSNVIRYISCYKNTTLEKYGIGRNRSISKTTYSTVSQHSALLNPWKGYDTFLLLV